MLASSHLARHGLEQGAMGGQAQWTQRPKASDGGPRAGATPSKAHCTLTRGWRTPEPCWAAPRPEVRCCRAAVTIMLAGMPTKHANQLREQTGRSEVAYKPKFAAMLQGACSAGPQHSRAPALICKLGYIVSAFCVSAQRRSICRLFFLCRRALSVLPGSAGCSAV